MMTVQQLINRLKEFDWNCEIEFQYYNVEWCNQSTLPSNWIDLYEDENEDWEFTNKIIIDLWDF